jgi:hypothetical protein
MPGLPRGLGGSLVGWLSGSGGHLVSLPRGFSRPLAGPVGAESLGLAPGLGHKAAPAVGTSTVAVHGFLLGEAVDLQPGLVQEEYASPPKERRKDRQVIARRAEGKNNPKAACGWVSRVQV